MAGDMQAPVPTRSRRWIVELVATMAVVAGDVGIPVLFYKVLAWRIVTLSMAPAGFYTDSPLATLHFTRSLLRLRHISGDLAAIATALLAFLLASISLSVLGRRSHSPRSLPSRIATVVAYGGFGALALALVELCIDA